jgi:hypothetical protein
MTIAQEEDVGTAASQLIVPPGVKIEEPETTFMGMRVRLDPALSPGRGYLETLDGSRHPFVLQDSTLLEKE